MGWLTRTVLLWRNRRDFWWRICDESENMSFESVIEDFGRETITGWTSYLDRGSRSLPDVSLYFRSVGSFAPGDVIDHVDERTGLIFRLPPEFRDTGWADFLEQFDSVTETHADHPEAGEFTIAVGRRTLKRRPDDNASQSTNRATTP
jgi:hypothetical protein